MSTESVEVFIKWLDELEDSRGWTDYKLSQETGLSSSVFSKARQGILPKWDALIRISAAFNVSPVTAFRKAGLLPSATEDSVQLEDWEYLLKQLSPEDEDEIKQIALMRIERRKKAEGATRAANFKPEAQRK